MSKPQAERTHGKRVKAEHERAHLTAEQIRRNANTRCKQRNAARQEEKRAEAEKRQAAYNLLSKAEKLSLCKSRRGGSKKEIAKISK